MKRILTCTLLALSLVRPAAASNDVTQGGLRLSKAAGGQEAGRELPLQHTDVTADISGFLSRVKVVQVFSNPCAEAIEAVYVFPLPQDAAVSDMQIRIGDRVVRGVIKKREEARTLYEAAKREGKTAALLDQERPNIFSQAVANILPGSEIRVEITYDEVLKYERGAYEFMFPMVVGPRYIPGQPQGAQGSGWSPDTDQVPDASLITPPVLKPGERNGHDISLTVRLRAGLPVSQLESPTHKVERKDGGDGGDIEVSLAASDAIPNKDFVLRYAVAADVPRFGLLSHRAEQDGYFLLMFQPPETPAPEQVTAKEMVFVVDCSGSMSGEPLSLVKKAMRYALDNLNANDTFQIIKFSETASPFAAEPARATPENVRRGLSYINGLEGEGGTEMLSGIKAALAGEPPEGRLRIVCFMTDGYIGNEREILAAIDRRLGERTRLFSFGVGSSVNRYLLDAMAEAGRGAVQYIALNEKPDEQVRTFYERVRHPILTGVRVDWGSLRVRDLMPGRPKDLFAGQPLFVVGRYDAAGVATLRIHGEVAGQAVTYELPVQLPEREPAGEALPALWARARIKELSGSLNAGRHEQTVKEITDLALAFRLMSEFTSFVAIEEKVVNESGQSRTIQVPVEMPEGVQYGSVFGDESDSFAMAAPAQAMSGGRAAAFGGLLLARKAASPSVAVEEASVPPPLEVPAFELEWTCVTDSGSQVLRVQPSGEVWLDRIDAAGQMQSHLHVTRLTPQQREELWALIGAARSGNATEAAYRLKSRLAVRVPGQDEWSINLSPEAPRSDAFDPLAQWLATRIPDSEQPK